MGKSILCFAASAFALAAMVGTAQAKMVHYEINGQRYSYSTNNRQQTEEARRHISAANAVEAARAKAEAERRSNPLVGILGSQTQREAAAAQERLKQILAAPTATAAAKPAETQAERTEPAAERKRASAERRAERRKVAARPERVETRVERPSARTARSTPAAIAPAAIARREVPAAPTVQSVHFDPDSGIKTVHMSDGTVHEEPFEVSARAAGDKDQSSLSKPEDTTSALGKPAGKAP
jgi:hypothetical protein